MSAPRTLFSSAGRGWGALEAELVRIPAGLARAAGGDRHVLGLHFGPPVKADCIIGGVRKRGVQRPGDISLVPAGADGSWDDDGECHILRLSLRPTLLEQVAEELGRPASGIDLAPRLQFRDDGVEAIGRAIKADLQADEPSDPLYIDLLSNALAIRLVGLAAGRPIDRDVARGPKLSKRQMDLLIDFIETHLDGKLHLVDLATIVGMSATRLKTSFRDSMGVSVHRYVIARRVEYARALIATTTMPAAQVALAAGFAHQSHMAVTMRRVLGLTPGMIARTPKI